MLFIKVLRNVNQKKKKKKAQKPKMESPGLSLIVISLGPSQE